MKSYIKFSVISIDDGDGLIQISIVASNTFITSYYESYFLADSFKKFAEGLINFPEKSPIGLYILRTAVIVLIINIPVIYFLMCFVMETMGIQQ